MRVPWASRRFWVIVAIIVVVIIILLYVNRNWDRWKSRLGRAYFDSQGEPTVKRKGELELLAKEAYDAIYGVTPMDEKVDILKRINTLNDDELYYLAKHYENALTRGNSLYTDIDDEWMPFRSIDEDLMARLNKIGLG